VAAASGWPKRHPSCWCGHPLHCLHRRSLRVVCPQRTFAQKDDESGANTGNCGSYEFPTPSPMRRSQAAYRQRPSMPCRLDSGHGRSDRGGGQPCLPTSNHDRCSRSWKQPGGGDRQTAVRLLTRPSTRRSTEARGGLSRSGQGLSQSWWRSSQLPLSLSSAFLVPGTTGRFRLWWPSVDSRQRKSSPPGWFPPECGHLRPTGNRGPPLPR